MSPFTRFASFLLLTTIIGAASVLAAPHASSHAVVVIEAKRDGEYGITNKTVNIPFTSTYSDQSADIVHKLYLIDSVGEPVDRVSCTPFMNADGTDPAGPACYYEQPSDLGFNLVRSIVCISSDLKQAPNQSPSLVIIQDRGFWEELWPWNHDEEPDDSFPLSGNLRRSEAAAVDARSSTAGKNGIIVGDSSSDIDIPETIGLGAVTVLNLLDGLLNEEGQDKQGLPDSAKVAINDIITHVEEGLDGEWDRDSITKTIGQMIKVHFDCDEHGSGRRGMHTRDDDEPAYRDDEPIFKHFLDDFFDWVGVGDGTKVRRDDVDQIGGPDVLSTLSNSMVGDFPLPFPERNVHKVYAKREDEEPKNTYKCWLDHWICCMLGLRKKVRRDNDNVNHTTGVYNPTSPGYYSDGGSDLDLSSIQPKVHHSHAKREDDPGPHACTWDHWICCYFDPYLVD